jgi:AcrR family transcriptional regulator
MSAVQRQATDGAYGASHDWLAGGTRREASQARILEVAAQLIAERGAVGVATEDICQRVGCSRATLYRYLGGRPAIFDALVRQRSIPVTAAVRRATAALTGDERVVESILVTVNGIRADPILLDVIKNVDREQMSQYLAVPESIAPSDLCVAPSPLEDRIAAKMLLRIVWSLVDYPLDDPTEERALAERFARAFRPMSHGETARPSKE